MESSYFTVVVYAVLTQLQSMLFCRLVVFRPLSVLPCICRFLYVGITLQSDRYEGDHLLRDHPLMSRNDISN